MSGSIDDWARSNVAADKPRASNGGCCEPKPLPYDPPKGPTGQMQNSVGLHGTNMGTCGTQGKH